jgi:hypothetical protein
MRPLVPRFDGLFIEHGAWGIHALPLVPLPAAPRAQHDIIASAVSTEECLSSSLAAVLPGMA